MGFSQPTGDLRQLLGLLVEGVDNLPQIVNRIQGCFIGRVRFGRFKNDENSVALIQNARQLAIQDHLRELLLHLVDGKSNHSGNMGYLRKKFEMIVIGLIKDKKKRGTIITWTRE